MPATMKKIGSRMKQRIGDFVMTLEVIGYEHGHEVWQVINQVYNPLSIDYVSLTPKRFE